MQEKLILQLAFNPGLALTRFRTTRPSVSFPRGAALALL